jgi:DNA-binding HxlR family transcriptional regulator
MPPRTEYRLTASGEALRPVLEAVELWSLARNEGKAGTSVVGAD